MIGDLFPGPFVIFLRADDEFHFVGVFQMRQRLDASGKFFHLILAGKGPNTVIVMLMGRYPLKDAGSINRFLSPKIDALLDFKPEFPSAR